MAEESWCSVAEDYWYIVGEYGWRSVGECTWYIIGCSVTGTEQWMWLCALAYWQLLLLRTEVEAMRPAWHPRFRNGKALPLTPSQVQRAALRYLLTLGTPSKTPRAAGKGKGRPKGYRPAPRVRYPLVKKAKTGQKEALASP